jgi:hypothetical protein
MQPDYLCVFYGNHIDTLNILDSLKKINIIPIVKNESDSARLAGFGVFDYQNKIFVHRDEYKKADKLIKSIL